MLVTDTYHPRMTETDRISRIEAAERLGLSTSQLAYLARNGKLRRHRNPETGSVSYDAAEVEQLRQRRAAS